jgi:capsular polysaccharide transport system permease protein
MVLAPVGVSTHYLWTRAADQYASEVGFSVRTEERAPAIEMLGGVAALSGVGSSDTDILHAYLTSQDLVRRMQLRLDLRRIWSRVPTHRDPVFALRADGSIEDLTRHWQRKVRVVHDPGTGLIDVRVLAFDPSDARRIAQAILDACSEKINGLSRAARRDAIRFTEEELTSAAVRLKEARAAITRFRNRTQIVDPSMDTQNQMGVLVTLQRQLAEALIEADLLQDTTRASDPRVTQAERRIAVIRNRIDSERRKLGLGEAAVSADAYASLVGRYEELTADREFAETAYTAARAAHDAALAEARRQSRYLVTHAQPTFAERAEYPERLKILSLLTGSCLFAWALLCLAYYSLRDRR